MRFTRTKRRIGGQFASLLICLLLAVSAFPSSGGARDYRSIHPLKALSGDLMLIKGQHVRLEGVLCPPVNTIAGRDAKALLNTFLKAGRGTVRCNINGPAGSRTAVCFKERRSFAAGMIASGLCVDLNLAAFHVWGAGRPRLGSL